MGLHNPPHPGRSIRRDCLEALGLTVTDGAKILGDYPAYVVEDYQWAGRRFTGDGRALGKGLWRNSAKAG
ncbi:MAG: hypothetical protein MRJ94_01610 [Nitrospirales bacterium]|nr:hypothetical protein [Nitrospirales bacterium]